MKRAIRYGGSSDVRFDWRVALASFIVSFVVSFFVSVVVFYTIFLVTGGLP